jgi:hypothetical protein
MFREAAENLLPRSFKNPSECICLMEYTGGFTSIVYCKPEPNKLLLRHRLVDKVAWTLRTDQRVI